MPSSLRLWCVSYRDIVDERLLGQYWELLSESERAQQRRFYFEDDRRRYLLTRALLRTVLSEHVTADITPREWTFEPGEHGRPYITNTHPELGDVSFNLSHTKGLILLALARGRIVGVDTEVISDARPLLEIADRFFAPAEVAALRALATHEQPQRFFQYWTLKEAYIKARGMGLAIPLDQFAFHFPQPGQVDLTLDPRQPDVAERWRFWQFRVKSDFLAALCIEAQGPSGATTGGERPDPEGRVEVFDTVPLVSERPLICPVLRASAA